MSDDLQLAAQVHYSFLPDDFIDDRLSIAVTLRPLYDLGGDYCSILPLDENRLLLCTCDAVGHGVSAALFAARINTYVLTHAEAISRPCELVAGLNAYLCKRLSETGMYTTFYTVLFDFAAGTVSFTGAAHPPVLQYEPETKSCREWPSVVTFLGITDPMPLLCDSEQANIHSGERFLIYSDGLIEAENVADELYGVERLKQSLAAHGNLEGQPLNQAILDDAEAFAGSGFKDDVLLMSVSVR